ncbi:glucose-6-phosphate isomerase [Streptobacillus moniliformis]|uniref:Glucose-6-phosphate isomerase n=1 Tax=Streptobacillus moniliformis (strain ATCC 14647 / DSM 12112 / NCTC 10651 / 9901) TaxID=519441 RepID=D1AVI8_STRM9|nr:glucose-6-phosphate isomerase [Streptobacillus moniliformis]ACZ01748.1 phosphoglucose isomerase (PGI) [Streptobacillus moniliformis DSM 12112]AVL43261.1 glucose-6-phosphate isomerase [Streptobacillus moniliformis]QXW65078.1 glucose-6-phosphate isomerase [Streptobacillus moniliformis]SQA13070.1 Glucose-6-phosphate isomerase [Streptobacillus moniliformis]
MKLRLETTYVEPFIAKHEYEQIRPFVELADKILMNKSGAGSDFLGWLDLPKNYDKEEFARIKKATEKIQNDSEILIVIGIGGSYLGAKSAIEFLSNTFYNNMKKEDRKTPEIYFAGTNISPVYLQHLLDLVGDRDFSINVISKSGTTTEPAIAFRVFKKKLEEKYGKEEAAKRIYATTDKAKGALKKLSISEGYETFIVPDNVGGRFSVLTAVGLLPIAVAGINIDELMQGAYDAMVDYSTKEYYENDAMIYAATRNLLYNKGKNMEILTNYEPRLHYIAEWWKQLFAESEGKDGKGIYPTSADFSTDLHSIGQSIQEARRTMFETVLLIDRPEVDIQIEKEETDLDGLNYLSGKGIDYVNKQAAKGVILAHVDGNVPNLVINIPEATAYHLGYMFYFFEKAVAIGGYMLGINPFDQPGVEEYKRNMFALLEKPGFEEETKKLLIRLTNR